jgi:serine/threonine-protein kinase
MAEEARVGNLVEQALNDQLTPEEACARDPELLREVKARLDDCRNVELMLEAVFPSDTPSASLPLIRVPEAQLPTIPGFEVLGVLGRGGIGIIYRVRHLKLNRVTALKMLLSGDYAGPVELARFLREARAVAALKHPNIVQIYDVGEVDARPYFTMELVEGGSLAQKIANTPQDAKRSAKLVASLARAVEVAHHAGIVHRDLKPGNILLTWDGVPKISDFGLASRFAEECSLTGNEARLGTPSYMAPEQVTGASQTNAPAVDVYALGAILYELLTGKPPFCAATSLETQRKVVSDEPVRPSRSNPKVPRDLDTICVKCLSKSPASRYPRAAALAEDLDRFVRFEPITARPAGLVERTGKWFRRRTAIAIAVALAVVLLALTGGIIVWNGSQRARLASEINADLSEVRSMDSAGRWSAADVALRRAEARLDVRGSNQLRQRVNDARQNLNLAANLDAIRLSRATACALPFYSKRADATYETIFRDSVHVKIGSGVDEAAATIEASPVLTALLGALDDWACTASDANRRQWILDVTRRSDPDPQGWRERIRDPLHWADSKAALDLAATVPATDIPVSTLLVIAERLRQASQDSRSFLRRVQKEHPADFYANLALGDATMYFDNRRAEVYYRAALAARPEAAVGYSAVADALRAQHQYDEALHYYTKALDRDPNYARAKCDLGATLLEAGQFTEAIPMCQESLKLDPNYAWAHFYLAGALRKLGRADEAVQHYAIIYGQAPNARSVPESYRAALIESGKLDEARAMWHTLLQSPGAGYDQWAGYPELCLFAGSGPDYRATCAAMLDRFASTTTAETMQQIARTCLLLPASEENSADLERATVLVDRALAAKSTTSWDYPYYLFVKALADYRNRDVVGALKLADGAASRVMGPCPKLIVAMALKDKGQSADAVRALAGAVVKFDWRPGSADSRDLWIYHILRREAQSKILPDLQALASGSRQPLDNDQRMILVAACQFERLNGRCAQTFSEAFEAEPDLMQNRHLDPGFVLACASCALAVSRNGADPPDPSTFDRARLPRQACRWLQSELENTMLHLPANAAGRDWVRREFISWKQDQGLADLRDPARLDSVAPDLSGECAAFWKSLDDAIARLQAGKLSPSTSRGAAMPASQETHTYGAVGGLE